MAHAKAAEPRRGQLLLPLAAAIGFLALLAVFASMDGLVSPEVGLVRIVEMLLFAGWAPALYLAAAVGLGRVFRRWIRHVHEPLALQATLGLGLLLTLTHLLGVFGLLSGAGGRIITFVLLAAGAVLLLDQLRRTPPRFSRWHVAWLMPLALLIVAASSPPGALWESEGRGYDVLSYHLPLPQEWLAAGQIRPLEHNVYSYLPSYIESAFYHLAILQGDESLIAQQGDAVIAAQYLSVGIALFSAWALAALVRIALAAHLPDASPNLTRALPPLTAALFLATPWTIITGSLAYNDLAVVAFGAVALAAALDPRLNPLPRGALAGLLVGFACSAKPTAIFMVAPIVGIALITRPRFEPRPAALAIAAASAGGLLAILPWLIRNWIYSGNPVFPQLTGLFGRAHWSEEQVTRYAAAHAFDGSILDRLRLLILPDLSDPIGITHRGLLHPQWFAFFIALALATIVALALRRTRPAAILLSAGLLAQLLAWLFLTHIQSRFLIPLVITGIPLIALALAGIALQTRAVIAPIAASMLTLLQLAASIAIFAQQNAARPNAFLLGGIPMFTGETWRQLMEERDPAAAQMLNQLPPVIYANYLLPHGSTLYLLGEATPLYYSIPTIYNTTYDAWPLADAMRHHPGSPQAQADALRARGITHILVNQPELARLHRSGRGWADPLMTPDRIDAFLSAHARPVRSWPEAGITLHELVRPAPTSGASTP